MTILFLLCVTALKHFPFASAEIGPRSRTTLQGSAMTHFRNLALWHYQSVSHSFKTHHLILKRFEGRQSFTVLFLSTSYFGTDSTTTSSTRNTKRRKARCVVNPSVHSCILIVTCICCSLSHLWQGRFKSVFLLSTGMLT